MRLYTIQKKEVLETIAKGGVVYPNDIIMEGAELAYGWMTLKMSSIIGEEGRKSKYPFWAFTELSSFAVAKAELDDLMLTLEIPRSKALLSDFMRWHEVLNAGNWAEFKKTELEVKKSWDKMLWKRKKKGAQACLWNINKEMVLEATKVRKLELKFDKQGKFYEINLARKSERN